MAPLNRNHLKKIQITDTWLIILILFTGAILRFWRLTEIPFTHDEFSAIIRTRFTDFHELIEKGVMIDGHPAGVQVLLFYMIRVFGESEAVIKTPFILFGLLSVWMTYVIGKKWFSATTGLVAAAFLSFLQFPVMYSQVARPYASGLFLVLLMVNFWTNFIFYPNRRYYFNLAGFAISAALCGYDHHFCMLFAVMTGVTGLFFVKGRRLSNYIAACALAIVLYLPHLPVLFHQLSIGGVEGWLQKPRFDFLLDHLRYVFHFSVFVYLLVLLLVALSLFMDRRKPAFGSKFTLISAIWFLVPYIVGFLYSRYQSSVLQHSVLIFSFPFLLFLLFGLFKTTRVSHQAMLVILVGLTLIPSLIFERHHYSLFYLNPYREIVREAKKAADSLGKRDCRVLLDTKKEINPYYLGKKEFKSLSFTYLEQTGGKSGLVEFLDSIDANYLAFGALSSTAWENYALIQAKFPWLIQHVTYCGGDFYIFSRNRPKTTINEYFSESENTFESALPDWIAINEQRCLDSLPITGLKSYYGDTLTEYSPTFSKGLRDMIRNRDDVIDISVDLRLPAIFPGAWMVATVTSGEKTIYWTSAAVNEFVKPGSQGRAYISLRLSDIEMRHHALRFTTYLWNPLKLPYVMDNFNVRVRSGNPVIYGLFNPDGAPPP
jgi:hypothetical protein